MAEILLVVTVAVAVEFGLMVWIGRAIGYRDRVIAEQARPRLRSVGRSSADTYSTTRSRAS